MYLKLHLTKLYSTKNIIIVSLFLSKWALHYLIALLTGHNITNHKTSKRCVLLNNNVSFPIIINLKTVTVLLFCCVTHYDSQPKMGHNSKI